jgi:hypothetical protein
MDSTTFGIVVAHHSLSRPQILLVKTNSGWAMPTAADCANTSLLLARIRGTLFAKDAPLELVDGPRKQFAGLAGTVVFELAISRTDQLREYIESDEWHAARWASFEEAFHIIAPYQEAPLKWCERGLRKTFEA